MYSIETKYGEINLPQSIVNKIVSRAVEDCDEKAFLYNYKGKYMNMLPGIGSKLNAEEAPGSIEVVYDEDVFEIKVYIVIKFGASIKKTTNLIIDKIYEGLDKMLVAKPDKVTIVVTGIASKNIAKRHIVVSK